MSRGGMRRLAVYLLSGGALLSWSFPAGAITWTSPCYVDMADNVPDPVVLGYSLIRITSAGTSVVASESFWDGIGSGDAFSPCEARAENPNHEPPRPPRRQGRTE